MKEKCAYEALKYIQDGMVIGLGEGKIIDYLIKYIANKKINVQIVCSSFKTRDLCLKYKLDVLPIDLFKYIDVMFDECDELDINLNAIKSNNELFLEDKRMASLADKYIVLIEEYQIYEKLPLEHCIYVKTESQSKDYVCEQIKQLSGKVKVLKDIQNQDCLLKIKFKETKDIKELNTCLGHIKGVIETSILVDLITSAISVDDMHLRVL